MANKKQLVFEHLEDVSWRVLKEYPQIVRGLLKGRAGVYALYSKSKLYYVGLASNLMPRLNQHLGDRHAPKWDRFSVYLTVRSEHIKELESLLLRIVKPKGNTQSGKFAKSKRLNNQLNREMTEEDKDRRARLLGGKVARRRVQRKTKKNKGIKGLKGLLGRQRKLKAWYKGFEYTASLRTNGTIRYGDDIYESPTAAARAILNRVASGWWFWHYRDAKGEWVRLKNLKK